MYVFLSDMYELKHFVKFVLNDVYLISMYCVDVK